MIPIETARLHVDAIKANLEKAYESAVALQTFVQTTEGDSDLYRKLAFYLTPNLAHWLEGAQAGNMKDLNDTLNKRK